MNITGEVSVQLYNCIQKVLKIVAQMYKSLSTNTNYHRSLNLNPP